MNYHYISHVLYQFIYSEPIYRELGGTFLVWRPAVRWKVYRDFRFHTKVGGRWLSLPRVRLVDRLNLPRLSGVLIANSLYELGGHRQDGLRTVLMYHGTSDKIPRASQEVVNQFDYYLLAGPKNEKRLTAAAGIDLDSPRLVRVGNWMFDRVVNGEYDLDRLRARFGLTDVSRPTILYAPTWAYGGGTLLQNFDHFVQTIPREYNLIIRPHYAERHLAPRLARRIPRKYRKHVMFANSGKPMHHHYIDNLVIADLLISDTSSMLYEYLITRRPIIISATDSDEVTTSDEGMSVPHVVDHYTGKEDILRLIRRNLVEQPYRNDLERLLQSCFYFNDGHSTSRCLDFLKHVPV
ncbi:MAG: hypothetical protein GH143_01055 [Calditrichaeota bacterium]|nr:hypothetical protein [Calditrichota bacterium]